MLVKIRKALCVLPVDIAPWVMNHLSFVHDHGGVCSCQFCCLIRVLNIWLVDGAIYYNLFLMYKHSMGDGRTNRTIFLYRKPMKSLHLRYSAMTTWHFATLLYSLSSVKRLTKNQLCTSPMCGIVYLALENPFLRAGLKLLIWFSSFWKM